jgi:hypothetical protein
MIRWPGGSPAGRVSDETVQGVDLFPTLAGIAGASVPNDRPIDGVDQSNFFQGKSEKSAREGILIWCADQLQAAKWRNFKIHFYKQETMVSPAVKLGIFNLSDNPREDEEKILTQTWVVGPILNGCRIRGECESASADRNGHARPLYASRVAAPSFKSPPAARDDACLQRNLGAGANCLFASPAAAAAQTWDDLIQGISRYRCPPLSATITAS